MKLLVLGAAGQIGHELCRRVWPADYRIAGVDRAEVDITRQEAVADALRQERPDIVINAAAYTASMALRASRTSPGRSMLPAPAIGCRLRRPVFRWSTSRLITSTAAKQRPIARMIR
jgi:hypothetical protein